MVAFIFGIIFVLIGVIAGSICLSNSDNKIYGVFTLIIGLVIGIALIVSSCIASVATGNTGVVTTFGRVEDYTLDAGVHGKAPWNKVIEMDNRVQKATTEFLCFSADIQEVSVKYTINYQISKTNAQDIYKTIGANYYETVITPNITESFKTVSARYTAEELIANRDKLASEIEEVLRENLVKYNIEIVSTAIEDLDFSDAFTDAVEAKQVAAQNKLKAQTEEEQKTMEAEQAAKRTKIEAEAAAEVAKIQAQADLEVQKINADAMEYKGQKEAAMNDAIAKSLSEELIRYYLIEQWDGKLPEQYVGSEGALAIVGK